MAVTGCGLFAFVVVHLFGTLQFFVGPEDINWYSHFLHTTPEVLWTARVTLIVTVALHLGTAVSLALENRRARPQRYAGNPKAFGADYAARTMLVSGLIVATFVTYHILHLSAQIPELNLTGEDFSGQAFKDLQQRHDVFKLMVVGFRQPMVSLFYVLGTGLLALHLSHGLRAMFQSVGITFKFWPALTQVLAKAVGWFVFLGYSSMPVAVLFGYGKEVLLT